jgi:hypothetical protein
MRTPGDVRVSYPFKRTRLQRFRDWFVCGLLEHDWHDLEEHTRRYLSRQHPDAYHIRMCRRCLRIESRGVLRP